MQKKILPAETGEEDFTDYRHSPSDGTGHLFTKPWMAAQLSMSLSHPSREQSSQQEASHTPGKRGSREPVWASMFRAGLMSHVSDAVFKAETTGMLSGT